MLQSGVIKTAFPYVKVCANGTVRQIHLALSSRETSYYYLLLYDTPRVKDEMLYKSVQTGVLQLGDLDLAMKAKRNHSE